MSEKTLTGYPSIDKPWLAYYPESVLAQRKVFTSIYQKLRTVWTNDKEPIINYYDTHITVGDFFQRVEEVAKSLCAIGVKEGDSIATSLESVPKFLELFLACELVGSSVKNFIEPTNDALDLINGCSANIFITHDYISAKDVQRVYTSTHIKNVILISPFFSATKESGMRENIKAAISSRYTEVSQDKRNVSWGSFLKLGLSTKLYKASKEDNILFSAFTSGTSGKPKEVLHTSKSIMGVINQLALFPFHEKGKDTWLLTILPPSLVAVVVAMMFYPLADGRTLILDPFCRLEDLDLEMMHYEPTSWGLIPLFFNSILDSKRIPESYDMSYAKLFGFGAETVSNKFISEVQDFFDKHNSKASFGSGYGQSEGGSDFTVCWGKEMLAMGSAGIPLIDTTISIFEPGTDNELTYGQIGEVCKTGPGIMVGYSDPDKTKEVLKQHKDGLTWLHTGDFGYMTSDGLLFVLGREGIRVYPDKTVYPLVIENKVLAYPGIKEAVVVAGNDKSNFGYQLPFLFLIFEDKKDEAALLDGLTDYIAKNLLPEEQPNKIFVIDKKPIRHFKTDKRFLQRKFGLI